MLKDPVHKGCVPLREVSRVAAERMRSRRRATGARACMRSGCMRAALDALCYWSHDFLGADSLELFLALYTAVRPPCDTWSCGPQERDADGAAQGEGARGRGGLPAGERCVAPLTAPAATGRQHSVSRTTLMHLIALPDRLRKGTGPAPLHLTLLATLLVTASDLYRLPDPVLGHALLSLYRILL